MDDAQNLSSLYLAMRGIFKLQPPKQIPMRHAGRTQTSVADDLAPLPLAVPELPEAVISRDKVVDSLRSEILNSKRNNRVLAHGQGGVGS